MIQEQSLKDDKIHRIINTVRIQVHTLNILRKEDRIGIEEPLSLTSYAYCQNDPINNYDPTGRLNNSLNQLERIGDLIIEGVSIFSNALAYTSVFNDMQGYRGSVHRQVQINIFNTNGGYYESKLKNGARVDYYYSRGAYGYSEVFEIKPISQLVQPKQIERAFNQLNGYVGELSRTEGARTGTQFITGSGGIFGDFSVGA